MKANGNGSYETCVQNLLKTVRGEVPYDRIKGINPKLIDKPASIAADELTSDMQFVIETYEPRVKLNNTDLAALVASVGSYELTADITNRT